MAAEELGPPPKKVDNRFDNWVFRLWKQVRLPDLGIIGGTPPILTSAGTGTLNISHSTSGVVTGTYGSLSQVPIVVVDTYGHVTLATSSALTGTGISGANLTISSPLVGTATNALLRAGTIAHGTSGVVTGTYGGTSGLPRFTVDTYGHVTAGTSFPLQATAPILVGSNAGTYTWGHSTSGIVTGTYGSVSVIPQVVVNTWGHVTAVNTFGLTGTAVSGADISLTSPIEFASGTGTNAVLRAVSIRHSTSGIVPGTFGGASVVPQVVVNTYGHVTAVNTLNIALAGTAITGSDLTVSSPLVGTATNALLRAGTIGHGTSGVIGGTYGGVLGVPRVVVDTWGHVTAGTSFPLQATAPILVGSNAGTFTWGHSTSGIVAGTYGAASVIPQVVVDTWGHVTTINTLNVAVNGTAVTGADLTVNSPLQGTVTNALLRAGAISHAVSGVVTGTYGGTNSHLQFVVNTYGHVTAVSTLAPDFVQKSLTVLGSTGNVSFLTTATDDVTWASLPVGYMRMVTSTLGTAGNAPLSNYGYLIRGPNRDSASGHSAIWIGYANGQNFMGRNATGTVTGGENMVWDLLWNSNNFTVASPLVLNTTTGAGTIGHSTSGIVTGTYGSISIIPQVVVNTYGHVTAVNTFGLTGTAMSGSNLTVNAPLQGTVTNALLRAGAISHGVSGVVTGTYGGALGVPRVVVDTYGHVTAGTSFPLQATAPILVGSNAGTYTWGHSTSGIASGTYGGSGAYLQVVVNTFGHVTAASTFVAGASTDYPMVKGSVPDGTSVTIGDGYQLLCVGMTVFGTGTIIVEGTGILAVL